MAFIDRPIISKSSEQSEESVRSAKNLFSQKNGFICREDAPDFGVDLQSHYEKELKNQRRFAPTGWPIWIRTAGRFQSEQVADLNRNRWPISAESANETDFISYTFLTSRLGYLCRHTPGYGLVLIYDDSTSITYYDFVENIVTLLSLQKGSEEWKAQESVNIHIPVENILNTDSIKKIHEKLTTRFRNHSLLINRHGSEFSIPVLLFETTDYGIDFHDAKQVAKYIQDYGALLFNNRDFEILLSLINELTVREIDDSLDVRFIIAIALAETGRFIDADYHLRKLRANFANFSKEKSALLKLYSCKTDFCLGRIDASQYLQEVRAILPDMELMINRLSLQLRINSLEILLSFGNMNRDVVDQLMQVWTGITPHPGLPSRQDLSFSPRPSYSR